MSTDSSPRPALSPRKAADSITALIGAASVRRSLALALLRRALFWGLSRASVGAREAAREERWAARASDLRLRAASLRPIAWTIVLEDPKTGVTSAARAASLIVAALELRAELERPSCPPRRRAHTERLFGTTLVPGKEAFAVHRGKGRHVLVGAPGGLWPVDVLASDGSARAETAILADLRACVDSHGAKTPVLALTARPRVEAAEAWPALVNDSPEAASLLSEALFSVFLDPGSPADGDAVGRAAQGGDTALRCFWHALQIVVFRDARAAAVGSFVAGVEGEGALEIAERLGRARPACAAGAIALPASSPRRLSFLPDEDLRRTLDAAGGRAPMNAGGLLRVPGFGEGAWAAAGLRPGAAVVVALRLALDEVVPDLDELECMVNLGHVEARVVTRLGTSTPEMQELLAAAKRKSPEVNAFTLAAIDAQRARVREAKRLENAEVALEFAFFALGRLPGWARAILAFLTRWVAALIAWRSPVAARADLHRPVVAIDSSVPNPPGVLAIGRFGVLAPARSLWIHHSVGACDTSFVLQLGPEHVRLADRLREAIPRALATVLTAGGSGAPHEVDPPRSLPAPTRLAYRRVLGILAALERR